MDMIFLHIESAYRPSVDFTDATDFLFHKYRNLPDQDAFTILGTPDKVIGQFIRDVFGVLCIHIHQYNMCSNTCEVPIGAALPLLER
jgi:hypothetical protein